MAAVQSPSEILSLSLNRAITAGVNSLVADANTRARIEFVARNAQNRAAVRLIISCALAAIHNPAVDIRKPYTEIGDADTFSGRYYDERYITTFIQQNRLPANPTTAFLTPALRNRNTVLVPGLNLVGRPPEVYQAALQILDDVYQKLVTAEDVLAESIRWLILIRNNNEQRMASLLESLRPIRGHTVLSSEQIVSLIEQHLRLPRSSRLPVLIVAAAYKSASTLLRERVIDLMGHNAADRQTGSLGDVEITLVDDARIVTCYEMKMKVITRDDIDIALTKLANSTIDNYIFITTGPVDLLVQEYAKSLYSQTGIEFVVLDCISFLRYFLHLFHRLRLHFLEEYQTLLLTEPESAVSQPLKEAFLSMRLAAESAE
jgi:DNA adenine methylase